ncbi:hypothetical protein HMPREF3185_01968, partial [Porphyromonas somerae]
MGGYRPDKNSAIPPYSTCAKAFTKQVKEALLTPAPRSTFGAKQKQFIRPSIDPSLSSSMTRPQKHLYFLSEIPLLFNENTST